MASQSKGRWVSMLPGNLRQHLGAFVDGWEGPENVEGYEKPSGEISQVRSDWSSASGKRRRIEILYRAGSTKITFSPLPPARSGKNQKAA